MPPRKVGADLPLGKGVYGNSMPALQRADTDRKGCHDESVIGTIAQMVPLIIGRKWVDVEESCIKGTSLS